MAFFDWMNFKFSNKCRIEYCFVKNFKSTETNRNKKNLWKTKR